MPSIGAQYYTNDHFSKFSIFRKHQTLKTTDLGAIKIKANLVDDNFQKSGLAIAIAAIALMIFSKFLTPIFSVFSLITGIVSLSAVVISSFREKFASPPLSFAD